MFAVFAMIWGNFLTESILLDDRSKYTVSLFIREKCINYYGEDFVAAPMTTFSFLIIPIVLTIAGSMLTALLNKTKLVAQASSENTVPPVFTQNTQTPVYDVQPTPQMQPIQQVIPEQIQQEDAAPVTAENVPNDNSAQQ